MAERIQELEIESKEYTNEMNKIRFGSPRKEQILASKATKQRRALEVIETLKKVLELEAGATLPFEARDVVVDKITKFVNSLKVI